MVHDAQRYDVLIVGGGPAGLAAALILGRCRRRVLCCDEGRPRNLVAPAIHGLPTREGFTPAEYRRSARAELARYASVEIADVRVEAVTAVEDGFLAQIDGHAGVHARRVLIATGLRDRLPDIPGLAALYGSSVFHCPYCDGWELRDRPLAALAAGEDACGLALGLTTWSRDVVLLTAGAPVADGRRTAQLAARGIVVREQPIAAIEAGADGRGAVVILAGGERIPRDAVFVSAPQEPGATIAERLGCSLRDGIVHDCRSDGATSVPGVYVAGDASRNAQLVVVAAAEGAMAAVAINRSLLQEELEVAR